MKISDNIHIFCFAYYVFDMSTIISQYKSKMTFHFFVVSLQSILGNVAGGLSGCVLISFHSCIVLGRSQYQLFCRYLHEVLSVGVEPGK